MNFLNKIIDELLVQSSDLSRFNIVLPGKRPVVFIKDILKKTKKIIRGYFRNFLLLRSSLGIFLAIKKSKVFPYGYLLIMFIGSYFQQRILVSF